MNVLHVFLFPVFNRSDLGRSLDSGPFFGPFFRVFGTCVVGVFWVGVRLTDNKRLISLRFGLGILIFLGLKRSRGDFLPRFRSPTARFALLPSALFAFINLEQIHHAHFWLLPLPFFCGA